MLFIVRFEDNPGFEDQRQANMPAHLDFLEGLNGAVLGAGPLFSDNGGAGGLWLVEAESASAVEDMVRADPLFATGLRRAWHILAWRQVLRDGVRLV